MYVTTSLLEEILTIIFEGILKLIIKIVKFIASSICYIFKGLTSCVKWIYYWIRYDLRGLQRPMRTRV